MARKKRTSPSGGPSSSLLWLLVTAVSGGGLGSYFLDDLSSLWTAARELVATRSAEATAGGSGGLVDDLRGFARSARDAASRQSHALPPPPAGPAAPPRTAAQTVSASPPPAGSAPPPMRAAPVQFSAAQRPPDRIYVATFNIQVFGESKLAEPWIVEVLAQIVRHCDVVAIQEVRAKSDAVLPRFVAAVNADGSRYDFLIGPRLGRTNSKEQYAFVYDTARVEYDPTSVGTMADPSDLLHREPFVARFRARTSMPDRSFTFWLVNVHTDPDEVASEVAVLAGAFQAMQRARPDEDDVLLLGDLNASETQLGALGRLPRMNWVVRGGALTNTRQTKAYDNVLMDGYATSEYTGRWGVYDFERTFGLTRDQALKVSDHLPVWAEFSAWETFGPTNFAAQPAAAPR